MTHPTAARKGRRPHFFKVFFAGCSSKRLAIPAGFYKHIDPDVHRRICLRGPSRNEWSVDLVRDERGSVFFQRGWEEFVSDHDLNTGDFLVFQYDGGRRFTVLVFEPTACEKEESFHAIPRSEVVILGESHKKRRLSEKEAVIVGAEAVEMAPLVKPAPAEFAGSCKRYFSNLPCADDGGSGTRGLDPTPPEIGASPLMDDHSQYGIPVVKEEPQSDEDTSNPCARDLKPRQRRNGWRKSTQENEGKPGQSTDEQGGRARKQSSCEHPTSLGSSSVNDVRIKSRLGSVISCRRSITKEEKARTLESAMSFQSKHPFGISVMRDSNVYHGYYMGLPSSLVKHLPRGSRTMRLRGPSEEAWEVAYIRYESRGGFSAGWGKFACAHNLESDDVLVFELSGPLEVRVHVYWWSSSPR